MTADRAGYIAGLRALADLLEDRDTLPLPHAETFTVFCDKATAVEWVRALPGTKNKEPNEESGHMIFGKRYGMFGPHGFHVWVEREEVCTRVVTGTREVTKTVPAPDAPTVEITETVEDVEWICTPLLAESLAVPVGVFSAPVDIADGRFIAGEVSS